MDKRNKASNVIQSSDDHDIMLYSEFLTKILEKNKTLRGKKKLFLLQMNRSYASDELEAELACKLKAKASPATKRKAGIINSRETFELYACEEDDDLPEHQDELFIAEFCRVLYEHGHTLTITQLLDKLVVNLKQSSYKAKPTMLQPSDCLFGNALKQDYLKAFYVKEWRERENVQCIGFDELLDRIELEQSSPKMLEMISL